MPQLLVHPEAEIDAFEAAAWYDGDQIGLGLEFLSELHNTLARIEARPRQFPVVFRDVRRAILHRFPFGVFFIFEDDVSTVIAITHLHRHPNVWKSRR